MNDKFTAEYMIPITPSCVECVHRSSVDVSVCKAFPEGIPAEILTGKHNHKTSYPGDKGITFKAK